MEGLSLRWITVIIFPSSIRPLSPKRHARPGTSVTPSATPSLLLHRHSYPSTVNSIADSKTKNMTREVSLLLFVLFYSIVRDGDCSGGYCSFPKFLWLPVQNGTERKWLGRTEYIRNSESWRLQEEISVGSTEIVVELRTQVSCNRQGAGDDGAAEDIINRLVCYKKDVLRKIICLAEELNGKFRVLDTTKGKSVFNCLKFEQRSQTTIQIYRANAKEINEGKLCNDDLFQRDEWPWIASDRPKFESVFCSIRGGFDFVDITRSDQQESLCADSWRPSRVETECIRSDGIRFYFAHTRCNPFSAQTTESFQCSAVWTEEGFKYILFGYAKVHPRFVLIFPEDIDKLDVFRATLLLSPLIPIRDNRLTIPPDTGSYQLDMTRSEPGVCFDESAVCRQYAQQGKCTSAAVYHYANYCKRSCGLCEFAPSPKPECNFPVELVGYWVMFNETDREEMAIEAGDVIFSTLGKFTCKSKHWENDYFKVFSVFQNGCRPRYSCMRLSKGEGSIALIDISSSDVLDRSFQLCDFGDKQNPATGRLRNWRTKILLPLSSMLEASCGLGGWLRAEASFSDGLRCSSHVWDVNLSTCESESRMTVSLPRCHFYQYNIEFVCTAIVKSGDDTTFLVTLQNNYRSQNYTLVRNRYVCWTQRENGGERPLSIEMSRVRCDTGQPIVYSRDDKELSHLAIFKDLSSDSPCSLAMKETMDEPNPVPPTSRPPTTTLHTRLKAPNKSPSVAISGSSRKLPSPTSEPFSYKNSHSFLLHQQEGREKGEEEEQGEEGDMEDGEGGGYRVLGVTEGGATNWRIRKGQDKTELANSSNSLLRSSSIWRNQFSLLAFATVLLFYS